MGVYRGFQTGIIRARDKLNFGLQKDHCLRLSDGHCVSFFVLPCTSGRMTMRREEKLQHFKDLTQLLV
jgi:hypothetical protein